MPCKSDLPNFCNAYIANRRLHLLELLGAGAYGKVYKARDTASSEDDPLFYAVKCMNRYELGSRGDWFQKREFSLHARVASHPNVVTFHDVIYEGAYVYVVLDLCAGGDLYSAIVEKRLFYQNDELLRCAFLQILDAVEFCHNAGVFHRDIKPDNILCSQDGMQIFLADFGLATSVSNCKDFGCGSLFYKSPESMGSLKLPTYSTKESDIWSLGIVLLNLVSGRSPWRKAQDVDPSYVKALSDPHYFQNTLPISPDVACLVQRIFDTDPSTRITIVELREQVIALKTFFIAAADLPYAPEQVRIVAGYFTSEPNPTSKGTEDGVGLHRLARPLESLEPAIVVLPNGVDDTPRHRAPGGAALFPPPRRRKLLKNVVRKLDSRTTTSSLEDIRHG